METASFFVIAVKYFFYAKNVSRNDKKDTMDSRFPAPEKIKVHESLYMDFPPPKHWKEYLL